MSHKPSQQQQQQHFVTTRSGSNKPGKYGFDDGAHVCCLVLHGADWGSEKRVFGCIVDRQVIGVSEQALCGLHCVLDCVDVSEDGCAAATVCCLVLLGSFAGLGEGCVWLLVNVLYVGLCRREDG